MFGGAANSGANTGDGEQKAGWFRFCGSGADGFEGTPAAAFNSGGFGNPTSGTNVSGFDGAGTAPTSVGFGSTATGLTFCGVANPFAVGMGSNNN